MENYNLLFYLKRSRQKDGKAPIYLRITVNGSRSELSTKLRIVPKEWDSNKGRAKGTKEDARTLNHALENYTIRLRQIYNTLIDKSLPITETALKNALIGNKVDKKKSLKNYFQCHINSLEELINNKPNAYSAGTIKHYKTALSKLMAFLKCKDKVDDILLDELTYQRMARFQDYLLCEDKLDYETAKGYMKKVKAVINKAYQNEVINSNPIASYKFKNEDVSTRPYLTDGELQKIINKKLMCDRLLSIKDVFIFACMTGLSFKDLKKLSKNEIITEKGKMRIVTERGKTGVRCSIPLLPPAINIINKYKNHPEIINEDKVLPVISNQNYNGYLKEIQTLCGIDKKLTTHVARHTFATTVTLTNGVPMETVRKMLGHTTIRTTEKYSRVVDTKVTNDMDKIESLYPESYYQIESVF